MTGPATAPFPARYRVRFDEAGPDGSARASTLLRYAQDAAWRHSEALGYPRAWYGERGLAWLVRAVAMSVVGQAAAGDEVVATTEVVGFRTVWARRRTRIGPPDGAPIAELHTDWVMIGSAGRPARVPAELPARFGGTGAAFRPTRLPDARPPSGAARLRLVVRPHELDPMGHVNHAVYVDHLEDAIVAAGGRVALAAVPRRYALEFLVAAGAGDTLDAVTWPDGTGWSYRLAGPRGTPVFRAVMAPADDRTPPGRV